MQETLPIKAFLAAHALCLQLLRLYNVSKPAVHLRPLRQIQACFEIVQWC